MPGVPAAPIQGRTIVARQMGAFLRMLMAGWAWSEASSPFAERRVASGVAIQRLELPGSRRVRGMLMRREGPERPAPCVQSWAPSRFSFSSSTSARPRGPELLEPERLASPRGGTGQGRGQPWRGRKGASPGDAITGKGPWSQLPWVGRHSLAGSNRQARPRPLSEPPGALLGAQTEVLAWRWRGP